MFQNAEQTRLKTILQIRIVIHANRLLPKIYGLFWDMLFEN